MMKMSEVTHLLARIWTRRKAFVRCIYHCLTVYIFILVLKSQQTVWEMIQCWHWDAPLLELDYWRCSVIIVVYSNADPNRREINTHAFFCCFTPEHLSRTHEEEICT